jgi:diguanylate cyclase (GGDEF)-like protein
MNIRTSILFRLRAVASLRDYLVPLLMWPVIGLVVAALGWISLFRLLDADKRALEQHAYSVALKEAQTQAQQVKRNLALIDQLLHLVRAHWQSVNGKLEPESFAKVIGTSGLTLNISVFDTAGQLLVTNTPGGWSREDLANVLWLPFFSEQRRQPGDIMFIGMPRLIGKSPVYFLRFSRKIYDAAGAVSGVVVVVLESDSLIAEYDGNALGPRGLLAALGKDGSLRALQIGGAEVPPRPLAPALAPVLSARTGTLYLTGPAFGDGTNRYVAWHAVEGFPLVLIAGADEAGVLALYQERERASIRTAIGSTIALAIFVLCASALAVRFDYQRYRLQLFQAAYRKATEGGNEGFYICRPLYGIAGEVTEYITLDCNERGADYLNTPRDMIIGATLSQLRGRLSVRATKALLDRAVHEGSAEGELEFPPSQSRNEPRQISFKAVRSDSVVAITVRDITLEKAHLAFLERKNNEDALTSLPNRAWIGNALPAMLDKARENGTLLAVLFIDLDGFKLVNDTFGHAAGDELLQIVARRLRVAVRPDDHVVRLGGDEFVVILERLKHEDEAAHVAARIVQAFQAIFAIAAGAATVGTSIGISLFPLDAEDVETLFRHADIAMYEVKTTGKNRYHFFDPAFYGLMQARTRREKELRAAIAGHQFVMHYQARVDCVTGEVVSLEALVRWQHPEAGLLGPEEFIPLAEETGLILHLGELIIDLVCAQISDWAGGHYGCMPVSINVSSRQFNERDIRQSITDAIHRHRLSPSCVQIELTESTMVKDPERTAQSLQAIHALGIKLLVDDFGTGYSSLSMLHQMDFDVLKVDKSFTSRLGVDHKGEVFFSAIITMAHSLGMRVVAEGVETPEQLEILRALECDEVQGFYLYRPVPADQLPAALKAVAV